MLKPHYLDENLSSLAPKLEKEKMDVLLHSNYFISLYSCFARNFLYTNNTVFFSSFHPFHVFIMLKCLV